MTKKIDWLNHLLEFSVVLIGILIAFQLNKCNTDRERQTLIDTHLEYLEKETITNLQSLEMARRAAEKRMVNLDSLLVLIRQNGDIQIMNGLAFQILDFGSVYFKKNAYNTLVQSGDIRFLQDFKLKSATVNMYEYYNWVGGIDEIALAAYTNEYYPYLKDKFDFVGAKVQEKSVYFSKQFANALGSYKYALSNQLEKYQDCEKVMNEYLAVLQK